MLRLSALPLILLALGGCQMRVPFNTAPSRAGNTQLATLSGTLTYRQRIALPPDAITIVMIEDVSRADIPAERIATTRFVTEGRQVPIAFALDYDPARIVTGRRYVLRARIEAADGALLWTTDTAFPLSFAGEPIDLTLVQASGG